MDIKKQFIRVVMESLSAGNDVTVDATPFTPDEIREMASATVWSGKGTLIVENSGFWTEKDKTRAAAADPPPADIIGAESVKIKFK